MTDLREMTILIVDDMENMCKSIRSMLMILKYGRRFHYAYNGLEAWKILQREQIDLAIVDWNMPVMTGVELLGRIRDHRTLREMPVVMVSAEANGEIVAQAAESDIDAYILKPLTVKSLGDKIAQVIDRANNPPPMWQELRRARAFEEAGDIEAAIQAAHRAMALDENSTRPIRELGLLHFKKGSLAEAKKWFLLAASRNPYDVFACHHLGEIYLKQENIEKAAQYFDRAVQISPRHVNRSIEFGKILVQKGLPAKAGKVFAKAFEITPDPLALKEEIARFCLDNGATQYAIQLLEDVTAHDPTRGDILFKLGQAHHQLAESHKALEYLTKAAQYEKDNMDIQLHQATVHLELGQKIRAEQVLKAILGCDPTNDRASQMLRDCLF